MLTSKDSNILPIEWPLLFGRLEFANIILAYCVSPTDKQVTLSSFKLLESCIVNDVKKSYAYSNRAINIACLSLQPHLLHRISDAMAGITYDEIVDKSDNSVDNGEVCCDDLLPWLVQGLKQRACNKFEEAVHSCLDIIGMLRSCGLYFTSFAALSVIDHPEIAALISDESVAGTRSGRRKFDEFRRCCKYL